MASVNMEMMNDMGMRARHGRISRPLTQMEDCFREWVNENGDVVAPGPGRCMIVKVKTELEDQMATWLDDADRLDEELRLRDNTVHEIHIEDQVTDTAEQADDGWKGKGKATDKKEREENLDG